MTSFSKKDLMDMDRQLRANFINSISGIRNAALIGTQNKKGQTNLAIFNSLVHIGANPPLLGFIMRPTHVERHTYQNIRETKQFTINLVPFDRSEQVHQTAAKYDAATSEFEACGFLPEYHSSLAPFVKDSLVQIGLALQEEQLIQINKTRLIIGSIEEIHFDKGLWRENGQIRFDQIPLLCTGGLNTYYRAQFINEYPYPRP